MEKHNLEEPMDNDDQEAMEEQIELTLDDDSVITLNVLDYIEIGGFTYLVVSELNDDSDDAFLLKETMVEDEESIFEELTAEEFELISKILIEESDEFELE